MVKLDKVAHFVVSLILTIVLAIVIKSVNEDTAGIMCGILAGIVTMCLGVGKEVWDKFRGTGFDLMDLAADLGGCVVAVIFSIFMQPMWWDKRQEYYYDPYGGNEDLHNDGCLSMFFWLVVSGLVCFFMGSCKTKYVSVPEYHEVIVNKHDTLITRDSIFQKDSVYMWMQGDTVWKEKYSVLYKDRWRDKIVYRDSIRVDSVRVPMPVVTNKMRWQDKAAYIGLGLVISVFIIVVIFVVRWLLARRLI